MKISLASDLHLEFEDLDIVNDSGAEVLILSGDICVAADLDVRDQRQTDLGFARYRSDRLHDFFERCSNRFPHVVYVMGNHEYYHSDFATALGDMRSRLAYLPNLHILEREVLVVDDVTFIGGTLWTDMNNRDPLTLMHMTGMMNDFRVIRNSDRQVNFKTTESKDKPVGMTDAEWLEQPPESRVKTVFRTRDAKFSPEDAVAEFEKFYGYIKTVVSDKPNAKFVVVGHHAPSRLSTHARYANETVMNGGYSSNLDEFIAAHPQIRLWTHGHTHHEFDYVIGETRVMCNPRGYYGHEAQADQWQLKTVTI